MNDARFPSQVWASIATAVLRKFAAVGNIAGSKRRSRRAEARRIAGSSLFDAEWYRRTYSDVAEAGVDPLNHFITRGWREGRDPGPDFATSAYLRAYADVARSGVNPLVHFIEFGHSEGREAFGHRPLSPNRASISFDFPNAAPCSSYPIVRGPLVPWRRSYQLDESHPDSVVVGDCVIGYAVERLVRAEIKATLGDFSLISGYGRRSSASGFAGYERRDERLADIWYVNAEQLRTRWQASQFPIVVRAFQYDPRQDGLIVLIGEGLTHSPLDVIDFNLTNAYFPVLFVVAEPDGRLRGAFLCAFPSLCRGGVHYPELLWGSAPRAVDPVGDPIVASQRLAARFAQSLCANQSLALCDIVVDLDGADGRGPMFQPDFKSWLKRVARISVSPTLKAEDSVADNFLREAVVVSTTEETRRQGSTLLLTHDMVPTLAALAEPLARNGRSGDQVHVPFLIAAADPAEPVTSIEPPNDFVPGVEALREEGVAKWPRLQRRRKGGVPARFPAAGIRRSNVKAISDAELLVPIASELTGKLGPRPAITWLVPGEGWQERQLAQALDCLALQDGGCRDTVALTGAVDRLATSVAQERFTGRVRIFADFRAAVRDLESPLVGFVGPGLLLHDNRCATVLSSLLECETVTTASCVLISVEKRGKGWHAGIADGGAFLNAEGFGPGQVASSKVAEHLWRASYLVVTPSPYFWIARSSQVQTWVGDEQAEAAEGVAHICSSLVTASFLAGGAVGESADFVPAAASGRATKVGNLVG